MPPAYLTLLTSALVLIQCMIGGTRLAYSFPAYALVGLAAALSFTSLRKPTVKPSALCLRSTLLLAGYVVLRACFSPNAYLAQADAYMAAGCLLVYLLTALYLTKAFYRNCIVGALLVVAVMHITVGAIQFTDGGHFMLFGFSRDAAYGMRASGMLICPDKLAGFLTAASFLALGITFWGRWGTPVKLLAGYLTLLCFAGVGITGSRGGYLSLLVGLLVFAALSLWVVHTFNYRRFIPTVMGTLLVLGLTLGAGLSLMEKSPFINQRLHGISDTSRGVRWYTWLALVDQFKTHPVLGTGAGTNLYYGRLYRRPQTQVLRDHPHNDYFELLAEYGLVGGGLAVFFLVAHIARGLAIMRQVTVRRLSHLPGLGRSHTLALTLGALSAVAALLTHSAVDSNMHVPGNALLFAFLFAMLGSGGTGSPAEDCPERCERISRKALVLAGIGLLLAVISHYPAEQLSNQARNALQKQNFNKCIRFAESAIKQRPSNPEPYFYLGEACRFLSGNSPDVARRASYLHQAIAAYRKGLSSFPQNEVLWVRLGLCLDAISQPAEAQEAFLNAIAADPNLGVLYAYYGAHLRLVGDLAGAERCENAAQKLGALGIEKIGIGEPPTLLNANLSVDEKIKVPGAAAIAP